MPWLASVKATIAPIAQLFGVEEAFRYLRLLPSSGL